MPKTKKRTYRKRRTVKRKRSKRAGMYAPDLSFFADMSDAKNSMIGVNQTKRLKNMINYAKKDISNLEKNTNLLKAYLRYNKNRTMKVMPSQKVKDILGGKDLYDMPEPTPRREAQRYYDLLEEQYHEYDYYLKKKKNDRRRLNQYLKGLESYHKHAKKHEEDIGVYKPNAPTGNF